MHKIREQLIFKLNQTFNNEEIQIILTQVEAVLADYEIRERATLPDITDRLYFIHKYFEVKKLEGMSKTSLKTYRSVLEDFGLNMPKPLTLVTTQEIVDYLVFLQEVRRIGQCSIDQRRIIIHTFYAWMQDNGFIEKNPCSIIKRIRYVKHERQPLSADEIDNVRFACRNDVRDAALIEFLFCTGCRVSELVNVKVSDIDFYNSELKVIGKGNKERTVYLNAAAKSAITRYLDEKKKPTTYLFSSERYKGDDPLSTDAIRGTLRKIGERAKLGRVLHPHDMRHTTATYARDHGVPVEDIQSYLGHSKLDTTMIYIKLDKTRVKQNVQRCFA